MTTHKQTVRKGMIGRIVTFGSSSNYPGAEAAVIGYTKYDDGSLGYLGHYTRNEVDPMWVSSKREISFDGTLLEVK